MENTIGITLETDVGVQSATLHVCREDFLVINHVDKYTQNKDRSNAIFEGSGQEITACDLFNITYAVAVIHRDFSGFSSQFN